jgi:hypothetical protein
MKAIVLENGTHQCPICDKLYSNKLSFNAHRHKVHGTVRNTIICPGPNGDNCGQGFPSTDSLAKHIENDHQVAKNEKHFTFPNDLDFMQWLADLETATNANFVHNSGAVMNPTGRYRYYLCNRSGQKRHHENKSGRTVGKGSSKIGACCPAKVTVKYDENKQLLVTANLTHFGHQKDLAFIPLPMQVVEEIEALLLVGLRAEDIPGQLRKTTQMDDSRRG